MKLSITIIMLTIISIIRFCSVLSCFVCQERISVCNSAGCSETCFDDQTAWNSQRSACLCPPNDRIKGAHHHHHRATTHIFMCMVKKFIFPNPFTMSICISKIQFHKYSC